MKLRDSPFLLNKRPVVRPSIMVTTTIVIVIVIVIKYFTGFNLKHILIKRSNFKFAECMIMKN